MNARELEARLAASDPVDREALAGLDFEAMEGDLLAELESGPVASTRTAATRARPQPRARPLAIALGTACVSAAIVLAILLGGSSPDQPARVYGAELVRFAESTPLLLLEEPGWQVRSIWQQHGEGRMEFGIAAPATPESGTYTTQTDHGPAVHRNGFRRTELLWFPIAMAKTQMRLQFDPPLDRTPGREVTTTIAALGARAHIDTRAETSPIYGRPGDHEMAAIWTEGRHLLTLRARVTGLAAFRERLDGLRQVDAQTWLDAMPARVVKGVEYGATVREMLQGIPLPPGFDPTTIPDLGLTTNRYQVGAAVGGAVACAWFRRWGEARAAEDAEAAREAEDVLMESETRWPIFREMRKEGAYPAMVIEYAKAMPTGSWYGRPLVPEVEQGLGCR